MGNENERTSPLLLDFDARLGLAMQLQHHPTTTVYSCDGISSNYEGAYASAIPMSSHNSYASTTGGSEKSILSASQWRDCERQKMMAHKYTVASVPVPQELSFLSATPFVHASQSQPNCNNSKSWSGLDLSFSSSSSSSSSPSVTDPEPWRCKRTDGKKWRCSRDVAPDHKYCERHAHKSRTRSRKHVELPSSCSNSTTVAQQMSASQFPTAVMSTSAATSSYDLTQTRCLQWQQPTHTSSPRFGLYAESCGKNLPSVCRPQYEDKQEQGFMLLNSYNPDSENHLQTNNDCCYQSCDSILGAKISSLLSQSPNYTFIDAWENECKNYEEQQRPSSSLSLSLPGGNKIIGEDHLLNCYVNSGNLNEWMNMNYSTSAPAPPAPGGPLGEALCLGNANTTRVCSYLASPQGFNNSNTNTTNSSKSSCDEDGRGHGPSSN